MWERIRTAIILLVIVGAAMFATREPILMLPLLFVGAALGLLSGQSSCRHLNKIPTVMYRLPPKFPPSLPNQLIICIPL